MWHALKVFFFVSFLKLTFTQQIKSDPYHSFFLGIKRQRVILIILILVIVIIEFDSSKIRDLFYMEKGVIIVIDLKIND